MLIRSKFIVAKVSDVRYSAGEAKSRIEVELNAVYASGSEFAENVQYAKATPAGKIVLTVDNPGAWPFFEPGREVYVDMTVAPRRCSKCHGQGRTYARNAEGKDVFSPCDRCNESGIDPEQPTE